MQTVVIGGVALVALSLTVWGLVIKNGRGAKNGRGEMPEPINVDRLGVKDVVGFFSRPEAFERLKSSPDKMAVAMKNNQDGGRTLITLTLFDKATNEVEKPLALYSVKDVDVELQNLFGDKDMLVIK